MLIKILKKILLFICPFVLFSCEIINSEEGIPSYIYIDKIDFVTDYDLHGTNSSKIVDAWINVDGNLLGVFELPARIPILKTGTHEVMVRAGIKVNGIAASRAIYPYYTSYKLNMNLTAAKIDTIHPVVTYTDFTIFKWKDDFEDAGLSLVTTKKSYTPINRYATSLIDSIPNSYLGDFAAGSVMSGDSLMIFECQTIDSVYLSYNPIFLELNYKCNNSIVVGMFVNKTTTTIQKAAITLNPSEKQWNKIYINLTDIVKQNPDALHYNIFIGARKSQYNIDNNKEAWLYFDNVKLVTF